MNSLKKVLNLVKKTGDKIVVMSENGDCDFLVMPLSEYEKIVTGQRAVKDMSEKELLDQVERDITLWRAEHQNEEGEYLPEPEPWDEPFGHNDWEDKLELELGSRGEEEIRAGIRNKKLETREWERDNNKESEPIKYEDIPSPPDIMPHLEALEEDEEPVIDMSFEDIIDEEKKDSGGETGFEEEPVY